MTPINFEAIMFLKFNKQYWDVFTVQRTYIVVIKESREENLNKKIEQHNAVTNDDIIE